jgi:multiple sugar transport system permease protein
LAGCRTKLQPANSAIDLTDERCRHMSYKLQKRLLITGFLFFPMLLMLLFLVWPTFRMVFYSFTDWDGTLPFYQYVGLRNYKQLFTDSTLWVLLKNNGAYALVGIISNLVALAFAGLLNQKMRGRQIYKTIIFLPYVLNVTAISYMFNFLYDFNEGPINLFMRWAGAEPIRFFSDQNIAIFTLVSMSAWRWLGYTMIIYLAALQSVDPEIYESSCIDGATTWQSFRFISLPNISRIIELQLFLALNGSFQAFTETLILTKGGPGKATYTFMYYVIDNYINYQAYGFAAAMSVILVLLILIVTGIQRKVVRGGMFI